MKVIFDMPQEVPLERTWIHQHLFHAVVDPLQAGILRANVALKQSSGMGEPWGFDCDIILHLRGGGRLSAHCTGGSPGITFQTTLARLGELIKVGQRISVGGNCAA